MSALPPVVLGSDESRQLQDLIRVELAHRQWSDGDEDEVMAEYILVMLANNKLQDQIASELEELVGDGSNDATTLTGVKDFVDWLWKERSKLGSNGDIKMDGQSTTASSEIKSREQWRAKEEKRRSVSPPHRATAEAQESKLDHSRRDRRERDRWDKEHQRQPQRAQYRINDRSQRNDRELFSIDSNRNERFNQRNSQRELLNGGQHSRNDYSGAAMDDPALQQEESGQQQSGSSIRILGQAGGNHLFKKSLDQTRQQSQQTVPPTSSIFSRISVPDPRAREFVPSSGLASSSPQAQQSNLLSRLDPMLPINSLPTNGIAAESAAAATTHDSSFPLQPTDTSLCRYSLGCTNPMCSFSHPSASAVSQSKKTGNEPLVLKQEPCRFQKDCTNAECTFSHISPAVTFIFAKAGKTGETFSTPKIGGAIACHYQIQCKNPTCTFVHYDPQSGQVIPTPALTRQDNTGNDKLDQALSNAIKPCRFGIDCTRKECHFAHPPERITHISDRLARFDDNRLEGEMEVIIPAA